LLPLLSTGFYPDGNSHRSHAEDRDDHWLFSTGGHTVVVPRARVAQDKSASLNR
jgi:hypothetical protein